MIILTDTGAAIILERFFSSAELTLRLFTNDAIPTRYSRLASFTEAVGGGYERKTLAPTSWTVSALTNPPEAKAERKEFAFNGPLYDNATLRGYFVVDKSDNVIWAERIAEFTPELNGDIVRVTPRFQMSKGSPA